jgi:hypothetical protein
MAKGPTGVNGQQYVAPMFQQNNVNKGHINPRATGAFLNTAKNQLAANPLAHTLSV